MPRFPPFCAIAAMVCAVLGASGCRRPGAIVTPAIEFTKVPDSAEGGPSKFESVAGRVSGMKRGQRIVLYAKSGVWWVQPFAAQPFTQIQKNSSWQASIHLGTEYAALLVDPGYVPDPRLQVLPVRGGAIAAVASAPGKGFVAANAPKPVTVHFSGYDWEVRELRSPRGGKNNPYDPENVRIDEHGYLHLRVTRKAGEWACAEVRLKSSLGPGEYRFGVRDVSQLDPAAVMSFYTWDDLADDQHHREVDIEVSRWGDPRKKNAQYVIQPYYEPANVVRFEAPPGPLAFSFRWEPGRVSFSTTHIGAVRPIAGHTFTSGVPTPGGESLHINLYAFGNTPIPLQNGAEAVIEKFAYLP